MSAKKSKQQNKTWSSKRTINPPQGKPHEQGQNAGAPFHDEDAKRRLGGFESEGEHARTGNRGHQ